MPAMMVKTLERDENSLKALISREETSFSFLKSLFNRSEVFVKLQFFIKWDIYLYEPESKSFPYDSPSSRLSLSQNFQIKRMYFSFPPLPSFTFLFPGLSKLRT